MQYVQFCFKSDDIFGGDVLFLRLQLQPWSEQAKTPQLSFLVQDTGHVTGRKFKVVVRLWSGFNMNLGIQVQVLPRNHEELQCPLVI